MIDRVKRKMFVFIGVVSLIFFVVLSFGIFNLFNSSKEKNVGDFGNNNSNKNVILKIIIDESLDMKSPISLSSNEIDELYDLVKALEFSISESKCIVDAKYYLSYDDNELYLDESCNLAIYNDKTYSVTKGGPEIYDFLKRKVASLENVYLFEYSQEKQTAKSITLNDEDVKVIKEIWSRSNKSPITLNLALILGYVLYIDGDLIGIQDLDTYVSYNSKYAGNFIVLSQEMKNILAKYIDYESACCSCCPNLEPGENCIDMCCPCN